MMTHDPMQAYSMFGAYQGVMPPYGLPQPLLQTGGFSQPGQQGYGGFPGYGGINPQQQFGQTQNPFLQHPLAGVGVQNPWATGGLQNPLLPNPYAQHPLLHNPIHAQLITQLAHQLAAQHLAAQQQGFQPYGIQPQGGASPFGQGPQWGQGGPQLAPQSWVGQGGQFGGGFGYGQGHPLSQSGRGFQIGGAAPWAGF